MSLVVESVAGLVTVQDLGRPGWAHHAIPRGGALAPGWLRAANAHAESAPEAAAVEVLGRLVVRATAPLRVATERGPTDLAAGAALEVVPAAGARVAYLAVRGGIDVPAILGSRSTLLVAGLGGLEGRALRRGDALPCGAQSTAARGGALELAADLLRPVRVLPGPDLGAFSASALDALLASRFTVSPESDRVGVRLEGPPLSRRAGAVDATRPMVPGAIEVPASGLPIVLGPDGPTTGGYPVLAVVASQDLGALLARAARAEVRFVLLGSDAAPRR